MSTRRIERRRLHRAATYRSEATAEKPSGGNPHPRPAYKRFFDRSSVVRRPIYSKFYGTIDDEDSRRMQQTASLSDVPFRCYGRSRVAESAGCRGRRKRLLLSESLPPSSLHYIGRYGGVEFELSTRAGCRRRKYMWCFRSSCRLGLCII